jgi:hypothetical protein
VLKVFHRGITINLIKNNKKLQIEEEKVIIRWQVQLWELKKNYG